MECHDRSACTEADELLGPVRRERELRNNAAALTNYESENTGGDTPVEKPSKFISGQERMPNPAYEQLQAELR